ncbi:MAG: hypothetical protein ACXAB4_13295, partial [Candidatus Hodarchaeales archaeon]
INSRDNNRTATLVNETFEISEANQYYTEILQYNIAQGYHTYYYKAEGLDIFEYQEQSKVASPGDPGSHLTDMTVIALAIWGLAVLVCLAVGGWLIRHKYRL